MTPFVDPKKIFFDLKRDLLGVGSHGSGIRKKMGLDLKLIQDRKKVE